MNIHIFGIRHHGPGSARNVLQALEVTKPDIILVEGPPEGSDLLHWVNHKDMKPRWHYWPTQRTMLKEPFFIHLRCYQRSGRLFNWGSLSHRTGKKPLKRPGDCTGNRN